MTNLASTSHSNTDRPLFGVAMMLLSIIFFSLMDVLVKWLAEDYPVWQIMFFRSAVALIPICLFILRAGGFSILKTKRPAMHGARALFGVTAMGCAFYGIANMPLAEAQAIFHSSPILLTALSVPLLKEKVGIRRWMAVLVGFIGMLLVVQPGAAIVSTGAIAMVCAALAGAFSGNVIRVLSKTEDPACITFYFTLSATLASGVVSLFLGWITPNLIDMSLMIVIGILGGCGQYFLAVSLKNAEIGLVSPLRYLMIVTGGIFGFIFWKEIPDTFSLIGIAIIISSGVYTMHREAKLSGNKSKVSFN